MKVVTAEVQEGFTERFHFAELESFSIDGIDSAGLTSFALVIFTEKKPIHRFWSELFRRLIGHGAEWFCGSGPYAGQLHHLWDKEAIRLEKKDNNLVLHSVQEATLLEGLSTTSMLATDSDMKSGESLDDCLVLVDTFNQIPREMK